MGLLKNIYWEDNSNNTIVYKVDLKNDYISKGSALTVREGQVAIFCHKGKMADVFLPGFYKLDSSSIPIITKLMQWKYGFENHYRSDVYFVNTHQFTNEKWGTTNPLILRDKDYGAIRVRGYGTYSFRVDDAFVFMQEVFGTRPLFKTQDITEYLRSIIIMGLSDAIGESKIPLLDMASNLMELSADVQNKLQPDFKKLGIELVKFNFQNFSLPEELEKAFDKNASLGMMRGNWDMQMQQAQMEAMKAAAANPGAGGTMGAGMGMGMGVGMGQMFGNMMNGAMNGQGIGATVACSKCGAQMKAGAKFCPECGTPAGGVSQCPKCKASVKAGAKFCPECGAALQAICPKCKAPVKAGAKFCLECGEKL